MPIPEALQIAASKIADALMLCLNRWGGADYESKQTTLWLVREKIDQVLRRGYHR